MRESAKHPRGETDKDGRPYDLPHPGQLTEHATRIAMMMQNAEQELPKRPTQPDDKTRLLRAKIVFEEAMELINAMGVVIAFDVAAWQLQTPPGQATDRVSVAINNPFAEDGQQKLLSHSFQVTSYFDMEGAIDNCVDVSVVTIGTMLSLGCPDKPFLEEVDAANLRKFGPGGWKRDDGKWMKGPEWVGPDNHAILAELGWQISD